MSKNAFTAKPLYFNPIGAIDVLIIKNNKDMMTNLQSSAFVARTTQLLSSVARLRLLLVMLLTLTVSANAWGAALTGSYTKITNISNLSAGDRVVLYADDISKGVTGWNGNKDATVSESGWVEYLVESASGGVYLKDENEDNYIASPGSSNQFKYGTKAVCTVDENGVLKCNNRFLVQNGTYYRMYSSIGTYKPFYVYKVSAAAPSFDITVKSNNDAYGSVSISGKTITATPNDGYRVKSGDAGYTVTNGTAVVTNNGDDTFTVTPSSNCTITINFEAIPKYTVTLNAGPGTCDDESLTETSGGAGVTLPTANPPAACATDGWEFAGWWTESVAETTTSPGELLTADSNYKPTSNITLYAVYQRTETTSGGGGETEVTKSVSISDYASTSGWSDNTRYATVNIDANITATASSNPATNTGKYYSSDNSWRFYQNESGKLIITAATGSTLKSITLTFTNKDSGTISYNGNSCTTNAAVAVSGQSATFTVGSSSGSKGKILITNISVTYTTTGGSSSTTYYHSTPDCATQTTVYLIPKNSDFWMAYLRRIFGLSSAHLRLGCCPAVASHTTRLPIATSSHPLPQSLSRGIPSCTEW